jgi:hypothetical protein
VLVAPGQRQLHDLVSAVDDKPAFAREHERRDAALRGVGEEDVAHDVLAVCHLADAPHVAGELGEGTRGRMSFSTRCATPPEDDLARDS